MCIGEKRENFPVEAFQEIQIKVCIFRRILIEKAINIARSASPPEEEIFTVAEMHVGQALSKLLCSECLKLFSDNQ
jgi:hypothetical protein